MFVSQQQHIIANVNILVFTIGSFMLKSLITASHLETEIPRKEEGVFWQDSSNLLQEMSTLLCDLLQCLLNQLQNYYFPLSFLNTAFYLMTSDTLKQWTVQEENEK